MGDRQRGPRYVDYRMICLISIAIGNNSSGYSYALCGCRGVCNLRDIDLDPLLRVPKEHVKCVRKRVKGSP